MEDGLLTEHEAADVTRLSTRTLERMRSTGTGPQYAKLGRRVLYRRADLEAWISTNLFVSTSAARRAGEGRLHTEQPLRKREVRR